MHASNKMKLYVRYFLLGLLTLSPAFCRAESEVVTHNFATLAGASKIAFSKYNGVGAANKVGTTDEVVYTCGTSSAVFGMDHVYGTIISLTMPNSTSVVTTSPVIEELTQVTLYFYPSNEKREGVKVYLSADGSSWGEALSGEQIEYDKGVITAHMPRGNYYIKLANTAASPVSVYEIRSQLDHCACFLYVP